MNLQQPTQPILGTQIPAAPLEQDLMAQALALLSEKQPAKKVVQWTEIELAQLNAFLAAAKSKGISLNTMNNNFKEMISPIFPGKSRSAFWAKSGEIRKSLKLGQFQQQAQQQA